MFRVILSFILTLFLFVGLIGTADIMFGSSNINDRNVIAQVSVKKDSKLSIKEIETVTATENYRFTYSNSLR